MSKEDLKMSRRWYERFLIHFAKYVALFFGGAILGGFIGYSIVNVVEDHGFFPIPLLVLGVAMLFVGAWIARLATDEEMDKESKHRKDNHSA